MSGQHLAAQPLRHAAQREDFTTKGFFDYWKTAHAPISLSILGSSGYVVSWVRETVSMPVERTVDAFIELWYPSRDHHASANEHLLAAKAWEDVPNYARTDGFGRRVPLQDLRARAARLPPSPELRLRRRRDG